MKDLIIVLVLVLILGSAIRYIIKSGKSGAKCIGCPSGGNCCSSKKDSAECTCGCGDKQE